MNMETENKTKEPITFTNENIDDKCVIYKDPDNEYTPLIVKISLTLYEMSPFDVAEGTAEVVFEMVFAYETKLFNYIFGNTRDVLPWVVPNALELDVSTHLTQNMYGLDLDSLNMFSVRQKFDEHAKLILFTVESYVIRAKLKLITFPAEDPFQSIFLIFKLAFDASPGCGLTRFKVVKGL